ncbi:MAG: efflux RND transporter periplasmic adaptor subunit, partial [Planctomycetota bacterium]
KIAAEAAMMDAEVDLQFARDDLTKYVEADAPHLHTLLKNAVTRAANRSEQADDELAQSRRLFDNGYINRTELEADELLAEERAEALKIAQDELALFENYSYPRNKLLRERLVDLKTAAVHRTHLANHAEITRAQFVNYFLTLGKEHATGRLEHINEQIADTRTRAPVDGTVIYAASNGQGRTLVGLPPLVLGDRVSPKEHVIHLISSDRMHLAFKIQEMDLSRVKIGMPVRIVAEAHPDREYTGVFSRVNLLPSRGDVYRNPDVIHYEAVIDLTGDTEGLRPGMNCLGEILVDRAERVPTVPVQAIVERPNPETGQTETVVYVQTENGPVPRVVSLGIRNPITAQVLDGVRPGDRVLLTPRHANRVQAAPAFDAWVEDHLDQARQTFTELDPSERPVKTVARVEPDVGR